MTKKKDRDGQILLSILECQNKLTDLIDKIEEYEESVETMHRDALVYNVIKIAALLKGMSKKTLENLDFSSESKNKKILESLQYSYPIISNEAILEYAKHISEPHYKQQIRSEYDDIQNGIKG